MARQPAAVASPAPDDDDVLSGLLDSGAAINVFQIDAIGQKQYCFRVPVESFDIEVLASQVGGGKYFLQPVDDRNRVQPGGRTISFAGAVRPFVRRVAPQPQPSSYPMADAMASGPVDPVMAHLQRLEAKIDAAAKPSESMSTRDIIDLVTRAPAQSQGMSLTEMGNFMAMMRPKSNVEELIATTRLLKGLTSSGLGDTIAGADRDDGGGFLESILTSPLGDALAKKLMESTQMGKPVAPRALVQPKGSARLPAPSAESKPEPKAESNALQPIPPFMLEAFGQLKAVVEHAPGLVSAMTPHAIADAVARAVDLDMLHEFFQTCEAGGFAGMLVQHLPVLSPSLLKLATAEGVLREIAIPDVDDLAAETEPAAETPTQLATTLPAATAVLGETTPRRVTKPKAKPVKAGKAKR